MLKSFPPAVQTHTRILIIGSMPGEASLRAEEYYAYKHNQFWRIIFDVFENGRTPENYQDKLSVILKHGLGLWDALAACERSGSLDSRITAHTPNDFPALFARYPAIHTLLFNGAAAFNFYKRAFGTPDKKFYRLPSTSPAHAARSYAEKLALWRTALEESGGIGQCGIAANGRISAGLVRRRATPNAAAAGRRGGQRRQTD